VSDDWALRPSQEEARLMSDMQLLQQDYQLITMVHGEAIKQVSFSSLLRHSCKEQFASRRLVILPGRAVQIV